MKRRSRQMRQQSQPKPLAAAERPVDLPARSHGAGDVAAEMRLECGAPGCELEAKPIVDHREASGGKRHPLAIDAAHVIALGCRAVSEPRASCDGIGRRVDLARAKRLDQISLAPETTSLPDRKSVV